MALNRSSSALSKLLHLAARKSSKRRRNENPSAQYSVLEPRQLLATIPGQVLINEIMYHPSSQNDLEEFVELHNTTDAAVNLEQWELKSGVRFTFPDATIGAGEYLVVAADLAAFQARYPTVTNVVGGWSGRLSNSTEKVELVNACWRLPLMKSPTPMKAIGHYESSGHWTIGHRGWDWQSDHDGGGLVVGIATGFAAQ